MLGPFPIILIAVVLYNLTLFGGAAAGQHDMAAILAQSFTINMFSGDGWKVTLGDLFVTLSLAFLFVEVIKATRSSSRATTRLITVASAVTARPRPTVSSSRGLIRRSTAGTAITTAATMIIVPSIPAER